jgi:hypothetical protein
LSLFFNNLSSLSLPISNHSCFLSPKLPIYTYGRARDPCFMTFVVILSQYYTLQNTHSSTKKLYILAKCALSFACIVFFDTRGDSYWRSMSVKPSSLINLEQGSGVTV